MSGSWVVVAVVVIMDTLLLEMVLGLLMDTGTGAMYSQGGRWFHNTGAGDVG